jgi:hypothetical protein
VANKIIGIDNTLVEIIGRVQKRMKNKYKQDLSFNSIVDIIDIQPLQLLLVLLEIYLYIGRFSKVYMDREKKQRKETGV